VTPPRYIAEDQLVFVTCGAVGRSFRFLPTAAVVQLRWFVLAVVVRKYGIAVHDVMWLSNHYHLVLTDVHGNLPDFMRELNSLVSRSLNGLRGSTGSNIERGYNIVTPADDEKVVEHCVYSLLNACAAHLVERVREWTGASSFGLDYGEPVIFERPQAGLWKHAGKTGRTGTTGRRRSAGRERFRGRTKMPERVEFQLVRPPIRPDLSDDELRALIRQRVEAGELALIRERAATGRSVLGMKRVLRQSWSDTPSTSRVLFETTPRVSGRSKWARIEALGRRLDFEAEYVVARDKVVCLLEAAGRARDRSLLACATSPASVTSSSRTAPT
jgi:putative transposase